MVLGFAFILTGLACLMLLERIYPDQKLEKVPGWWFRVLLINFVQLSISLLGVYTWDKWLRVPSLFHLGDYFNPVIGGLVGYLINTWLFYWWHRARHEIYAFWILFHQVHHSAQRIEAITSFYKHPLEILADSVMMSILMCPILGLSPESSIWVAGFSAFGEYFYHMNIRTPQWLGYFFQRPESHRIHHYKNKRVSCDNYSDCPFWDMLGGTFSNPKIVNVPTGFEPDKETRLVDMLLLKDVLNSKKTYSDLLPKTREILPLLLLLLGCLQPFGYIFNFPALKGLGLITVASPLPLVFSSFNGVETFSTSFDLDITTYNGTKACIPMTSKLYSQLKGPYNLRNAYGVLFSHGPFFNTRELITLRQQVLTYGLCQGGLSFDLGVGISSDNIQKVNIVVTSNTKTKYNLLRQWGIVISCHNSTSPSFIEKLIKLLQ